MGTNGRPAGCRMRRTAAVLVVAALGVGGLAACSEDSSGPEAGPVTLEDLQEVEDGLAELEARIGAIESGPGVPREDSEVQDGTDVLEDPAPLVGLEVTVSATVTEVYPGSDVGSAFRIGGNSGEPIAVITPLSPVQLDTGDVVQVAGTVVVVQRDSFETDFGIAADELFVDPDAFFADARGEVAVAADRVEVLPDQEQD